MVRSIALFATCALLVCLALPFLGFSLFVFFLIFSFAFLVAFRLSSKRQQGKKKRKATLLLKSLITELTQLIGWASRDRQVAAGTRTALGDWRRWFFRCGGVHGGGIARNLSMVQSKVQKKRKGRRKAGEKKSAAGRQHVVSNEKFEKVEIANVF